MRDGSLFTVHGLLLTFFMTTDQLTTLVDAMILWDTEAGAPFPFPNQTLERLRGIRQAVGQNDVDALLRALHNRLDSELERAYAAANLARHLHRSPPPSLSPDQYQTIAASLANALKTETSQTSHFAIIRALQATRHQDALYTLINTLCTTPEPDIRSQIAAAIRAYTHNSSWRQKLESLITYLHESGLHRVHLDAAALLTACLPSTTKRSDTARELVNLTPAEIEQEQQKLTNALIEHAVWYHDDDRMTSILAALLSENCGRNLSRANQCIQAYETSHQTPPAQLDPLRLEINATVTPAELQTTLESRFYTPLTRRQEEVNSLWQKTVSRTQTSLWIRLYLSVLIQGTGWLFFVYATGAVLLQGVKNQYVIGIVTGLALIALSFFFQRVISGTRDILADVGIANAAYLAFVQRTLHISTGYAQQYLQNRLTAQEIEASSNLVQSALEATVKSLRPDKASLDELIDQFIQ